MAPVAESCRYVKEGVGEVSDIHSERAPADRPYRAGGAAGDAVAAARQDEPGHHAQDCAHQ
eukprot:scaffold48089_cov53-Phaeocystis_antarctica.AAC.1